MIEIHKRPSLFSHERVLILFLCGGMLFFSLISLSNSSIPEVNEHLIEEEGNKPHSLTVTVAGAVDYPGVHTLNSGATMRDLMEIALPTALADLKKVKMGSKLRNGQVVVLKQLKEKQVKSLEASSLKLEKVKKK